MSTKNINYLLNHSKSSHEINKKDEELCKLIERDHGMRLYYIFKRICEIVINSFVVIYKKWLDVEIDLEQNEQLVKGITTNLMTQKIGTRRVKTKKRHGYTLSNLCMTIQVFK